MFANNVFHVFFPPRPMHIMIPSIPFHFTGKTLLRQHDKSSFLVCVSELGQVGHNVCAHQRPYNITLDCRIFDTVWDCVVNYC